MRRFHFPPRSAPTGMFRAALLCLLGGALTPPAHALSTPVTVGYRDASFGPMVPGRATAEKPESKLWYTDGRWWGVLWDDALAAHRIHEFNMSLQSWESVGPDVELRPETASDCLWDGSVLYVTSHELLGNATTYLRSYDYDSDTRTYTLRPGFPVVVNNKGAEALTIAKDTTGKLWTAWERGGDIWVNCSLTSDTDWGTPFMVPVQGTSASDDDICVVTAFDDKIGVLWSNQVDHADYFAWHDDGDPDAVWAPREVALQDSALGSVADDHLNIAVQSDGTVFAVVKTSLTYTDDPILLLLRRDTDGDWTRYEVGLRHNDFTRPIVLIDEESRELHIFMNCIASGDGTINWKTSDLDDISFPVGTGEVFIESEYDTGINDPTSTKQGIDSMSGVLVAASDGGTRHYFHNFYRPLSAPIDFGYRDSYYGTVVGSEPTESMAESKLWWNDGSWWACLWDDIVRAHRIHEFDKVENGWRTVGPDADTRPTTLVDCLWDGETLYIASHPTGGGGESELRAYSYDLATRTYTLKPGFPAVIMDGNAEAMTIAKDTTGKLWATWESGRYIRVNRSLGSDSEWGVPFKLPAQIGKTEDDDISAIHAFGGKVGILWSDQSDDVDYFAYHVDGDPDTVWTPAEIALAEPGFRMANDHLSLAAGTDGTLYAAAKTDEKSSGKPGIVALRRDVGGAWTYATVNTGPEGGSRPTLLIDEGRREMHVFFNSDETGEDAIHWKSSNLDNMSFPAGDGEPFILGDNFEGINNPTTTKQSISSTTGIMVAASDAGMRFYVHRFQPVAPPPLAPDAVAVPGEMDFGTVDVGVPMSSPIAIRNYGAADLHVTGTTLGGANGDQYSITAGSGSFVVVPGDSSMLEVTFQPETPGAMTAWLQVDSDDPSEPTLYVALDGIGMSSITGAPELSGRPGELRLATPFPNPAPGLLETTFRFVLPGPARATLSVYDVRGRLVTRRDAGTFATGGVHSLRWNPEIQAAGTYFVRLTTDAGDAATKTWVVIR